jgi:hypothetical protein
MKRHLLKILGLALLITMTTGTAILAQPPIPMSVYGTVTVDGNRVPDNTEVTAWCGGVQAGLTTTFTPNGETWSWYSLDVQGDDLNTAQKEGCELLETVVFRIGDLDANETLPWQPPRPDPPQLDLTASTADPCHPADVHPNADHNNPVACDGDVDIADIERVAGCFNQPFGSACPLGLDLDDGGSINLADVIMVATEWPWP